MYITEATIMFWFLGGYVLSALAFYTFITKTAQDEPDYEEYLESKPTPLRQYITLRSHEADTSERKAA
jgi:hypothetical protein